MTRLTNYDIYAVRSKRGETALQVAIARKRPTEHILNIIRAFPRAMEMRDNKGQTPLDVAIRCGADVSVLWVLMQSNIDHINSSGDRLLVAATRPTKRIVKPVHIHLVGHGYAGKTTCRLALNETLKHTSTVTLVTVALIHSNVAVDRSHGLGRTEGMEMDVIQSSTHRWLIRDYGGQEDFHVNHSRFLSVPGSIYVIVVALWDAEKQCKFSLDEVRNRFVYWLKFLNSIAVPCSIMQCITVVNFAGEVGKQFTDECCAAIKLCSAEWKSYRSSVKLCGDPCVMSVNRVYEVRRLNHLLKDVTNSADEMQPIPILSYVSASEKAFDSCEHNNKLLKKSEFMKAVCLPAICSLLSITDANSLPSNEKHIDFVSEKMIEYLLASGKIMVVPTSLSVDDPLIVLDINWLSKELLGSLLNKMSLRGGDEFVLTANEIDMYTNNGSKYFGGSVDGLVSFLESIGCCIALNVGDAGEEVRRWFPLCGQRKFVSGQECVALQRRAGFSHRKVVRLFKLSDPAHQMFPPGYFIDLFLKILSALPLSGAKTIKVYINGLDVVFQLETAYLQILLKVLDNNTAFTLEGNLEFSGNSFDKKLFWARFTYICEMIMNPREVYVVKDIIRVSPWYENVKVSEMFVNPEDCIIARQQSTDRVVVQELRTIKSLVDVKSLNAPLQNLYIYGCNERDMPVNDYLEIDEVQERDMQKLVNARLPTSLLGRGAFGVVYRGVLDGVPVAVKYILSNENRTVEEFRLEVVNLLKVQTIPGIIRIFAVDAIENPTLIIMELAMCSLSQLLHDENFQATKIRLTPFRKVQFIRDLTETLAALAQLGMRHRDIKPGNILVTHSFACKLSDFGTARGREDVSAQINLKGTNEYVAPEIRKHFHGIESSIELYGEKSDVYSFGVTINELLAERRPYHNEGGAYGLYLSPSRRPQMHSALWTYFWFSGNVTEIIRWCWKEKPRGRPTFAELNQFFSRKCSFDPTSCLYAINGVLQMFVKSVTFPHLCIVTPVVKKASVLPSYNPNNWSSNDYALYFVCSHTHQVVPCGPEGTGYNFRRDKEWFKKVAPVLKVSLIAAKIALNLSGVPLPIPALTEDSVAVSNQYLDAALKIVDAANEKVANVHIDDRHMTGQDFTVDRAEQYLKSLEDLLQPSEVSEAYQAIKALLKEVDFTLGSVGLQKMTSISGVTAWVKKGDLAVTGFNWDYKWHHRQNKSVILGDSDVDMADGLWMPASYKEVAKKNEEAVSVTEAIKFVG